MKTGKLGTTPSSIIHWLCDQVGYLPSLRISWLIYEVGIIIPSYFIGSLLRPSIAMNIKCLEKCMVQNSFSVIHVLIFPWNYLRPGIYWMLVIEDKEN